MATANLTAARVRELFHYDPDSGKLYRLHGTASREINARNPAGYIMLGIDGGRYMAHRVIWLYVHGRWPEFHIDHVNRIKHDNRLVNLRDVPREANLRNRSDSKKLVTMMYAVRNGDKWDGVCPEYMGSRIVGTFDTPEEANKAAMAAHKWAKQTEGRERPRVRTDHLTR